MVSENIPNVPPLAKFKVGGRVRTRKGSKFKIDGLVMEVIDPPMHLKMLWDSDEPHYRVKDKKTGEFLDVIERGLEKA